jgi:hypothetical protein
MVRKHAFLSSSSLTSVRWRLCDRFVLQVNVPKSKRAFCAAKQCRKHTVHKVTQYKTGKASLYAQGKLIQQNIIRLAGRAYLCSRRRLSTGLSSSQLVRH